MAISKWSVNPANVDRVELTWGDEAFWIELKRELSVGEKRFVQTAGFRNISGGDRRPGVEGTSVEIGVDWKLQSFARTQAYLTDWSLTDDDGNKLKCTDRDVIESLHEDLYEVIETAISKHVEAQDAKKKARSGAPAPSPTSS